MSQLIKYPSTPQFRDIIKRVRDSATYHNVPVPSVSFIGTVKLHGTNAAICYDPATDEMWCQSRENVITPEKDNAGFAIWVHGKRKFFHAMMKNIAKSAELLNNEVLQLYGEWCGGSIQKGVGLNKVPKMFVAFAMRASVDAESTEWYDVDSFITLLNFYTNDEDFYSIYDFASFSIDIDMAQPGLKQNELIDLTNQVEACCPVARVLVADPNEELVGEGIVWTAVSCTEPLINIDGMRFKVKGEKHSVSKVKTLAAVDPEKVHNINEFAANVCTVNRLEQGIDVLKQRGIDITSMTNIGEYIKWVMGDIMKEELDTIAANNLSTRDVQGACINKIKEFYRGQQV